MAMKIVGPIEAFFTGMFERHFLRAGNGTPARTKLSVHFLTLEKDAEAFAKFRGVGGVERRDLKLPELGQLAQTLNHGWSGEGGWDTLHTIKGIEAATAVRQNDMAKADPNEI